MHWKNITLTLALITSTLMIYSQKSLNDIDGLRKNAISFNFLGPTPWIGMSFFGKRGFNFGFDVGPGIDISMNREVDFLPWLNLRLGYRF